MSTLSPEEIVQKMMAKDAFSQWLGVKVCQIEPGTCTLRMTVREDMINGFLVAHGGITFSLADSAFAFACNSRNQITVAQHNTINFIAPGHLGDRLFATAREVSLIGRSGIYDATVKNQDGKVIAEFRGMSRAIRGQLFEENA